MGKKAEKGTPKDLANKMKAKGLQKLRWYCQMCQKQCRDENGFKCHTMSESHQRQLLLFADNPEKYLDSFSEEFKDEYLSVLRRRFGTKRVPANNAYQEYIQDRNHVHMNATQWETLTEFVKWLGREGYCVVDETEKGWYVTYIDRDPETLLRQKQREKKEKHEKDEEDRRQEFIQKQIELGRERAKDKDVAEPVFTDLVRESEEAIKLNMNIASSSQTVSLKKSSSFSKLDKSKKKDLNEKSVFKEPAKKRSALDEIMQDEMRRKIAKMEREQRDKPVEEPWVTENIVVKLIAKSLGEKYNKKKGVIQSVTDGFTCQVKLLESGAKLKLDQSHLETVVPSVGREVLILSGRHKGRKATLKTINVDSFSATLTLRDDDRDLKEIPYEMFSKYHSQK